MLDATTVDPDGPKLTRSSPLSMLFCTANSLNNPFQKDCALNRDWVSDPYLPGPFGDYVSFDQEEPYSQPIVTNIEATPPLNCNASPPDNYYQLSARVQDTLAVVNGEVVNSVRAVSFWYWFDADGDDDEPGGMWTKVLNQSAAADATAVGLNSATLNGGSITPTGTKSLYLRAGERGGRRGGQPGHRRRPRRRSERYLRIDQKCPDPE
jgi:hypothetical protein